jgi:MoaA/NifB/PqqE/SkfB family radical SAM enzyme
MKRIPGMALIGRIHAPASAVAREAGVSAGYAPLPWGIDLLLTDACNLRCSYCPITTDHVVGRPTAFMDTAKAIGLLESVAYFQPMIRVFGGEPFLHPQWPRIFSTAVVNGLPLRVVTNGIRLVGRAKDLVQSGLIAIGISVDPPVAHDTFRGAGTFSLCKRVIEEINRAKEELGSSTPAIEIYTTVHEGTYAALTDWAEQLRDWKVDLLRIQHQIWLRVAQRPASERLIADAIGDSTFFRSDVDTYCSDAMPNIDATILESELRGLQSAAYPFRLELQPPLPVEEMIEFYRNPDFKRRTARACTLISNYAFVDPRGRLYPCLTLDMGNVFEEPFERVWNGSKFRAFRRLLQREQRLPLCERCPA